MEELRIEYLPVDALKPYERNARKHAYADVEAIMRSIEEFGFDDPIGIWGKENLIVEGHGRLEAAKQLAMETVPVIRLDHLTDEQRRAYALAHNKTAELSGWDFAALENELNELEADFNMADFGFTENTVDTDALDDLFAPAEEKEKEPKRRWIPVTERLPEVGEEVLVFAVGKSNDFSSVIAITDRMIFRLFPSSEGVETWRSPWQYFMTNYEITHWMPLPEPPKEEDDAKQ